MKAPRQIRQWDRVRTEFVQITVESFLDTDMSCKECHYYDSSNGKCGGVGSVYYMKQVPYPEFIPKLHECKVRLPPSLLTFF